MSRLFAISSFTVVVLLLSAQSASATPVWAGIFGNRNLTVENPNDPTDAFNGGNYQMVLHVNSAAGYDAIEYSAGQGWGFVVTDLGAGGRNTSARFGPFDDSPNGRNSFDNHLPNELYDSFIGFKNHPADCNAGVIGDPDSPCAPTIAASGGIFRIDVPNGIYRFVAVAGSASNNHVSRFLVEDGGSGSPADLDLDNAKFVVLVSNHDQARNDNPDRGDGDGGNFAVVGFDGLLPPEPVAPGVLPFFTNMDADGLPTDGDANSPLLTVTQGYIRLHFLQGNSNAGDGGGADANGADLVLFEAHNVIPEPSTFVLAALGLLGMAGGVRRRRRRD